METPQSVQLLRKIYYTNKMAVSAANLVYMPVYVSLSYTHAHSHTGNEMHCVPAPTATGRERREKIQACLHILEEYFPEMNANDDMDC
jgi:hypothetical protein